MGLRIKVVLWVLVLFTLCGGLSLWVLRSSVEQSYAELEQKAALDDFSRLLHTLDDELALRDRVLREWSLWADFYQFAADGNTEFAAKNLTPQAIANSGLSWLGLHQGQGQLQHSVLAPQDLQSGLPGSLSPEVRELLGRGALAGRGGTPCGIARVGQRLLMLCQRPLLDGVSAAPARGHISIAEWVSADIIKSVEQRSGLTLKVQLLEPGQAVSGMVATASFDSLTGAGPLKMEADQSLLLMRWPLRDVAGVPVAVMETRWPRHILPRGKELLGRVQWLVLLLAGMLALGVVLVVDRIVVVRLARLQSELAGIRTRREWAAAVRVDGHDEITELADGANHLLGVIASQVQTLEQLSQTDALTGLANRRRFSEGLEQALRARQRSGEPLSLLLFDVDFFKAYNDRYGHQQGDRALQAVAACLSAAARRPSDLAARMGGEEFALLLENTDLAGARHCAAEIRAALKAQAVIHEAGGPGGLLTLSMGAAQAEPGETADSLYLRADTALYRAKAEGRDRLAS